MPNQYTYSSIEERFWAKVQKGDGPEDCWVWTAHTDEKGYGTFSVYPKMLKAHRYAYETLVGSVPEDRVLDHLCRNPACVNPDHLEVVTNRENILRGVSIVAVCAKVTHCPQGHPYDSLNTRLYQGRRYCKACQRKRDRSR